MIRIRTARGLLISGLLLGLGTGLFVAVGLAPADARAAMRLDGVKEGGKLVIGVRSLDVIDPTLAVPFNGGSSTVALAWRNLHEATCALLFRYPVAPPPVVRYDLVAEVAAAYPALSSDGRTYTFTIRPGYRFSTAHR